MKRIILLIGITLFSISIVSAQTSVNDSATRQLTLQKGKVLRKTSHPKGIVYHGNNGTRDAEIHKKNLIVPGPRTQPMVTKPLVSQQQ